MQEINAQWVKNQGCYEGSLNMGTIYYCLGESYHL